MMTEIIFFTSSPIKLAHARYLCRNYAVQISGFREKTFGANYVEPRIYDRAKLIDLSYHDALKRWLKAYPRGGNRLFFIEDTSVIIDALSVDREIPGLDVKYWMAEINFEKLNAQLKASGNNRHVTIRSDLILHLPQELRGRADNKEYLCFTSTSSGKVIEKEIVFDTNPMYPWLDNQTFNKWFTPDGCIQPISTLPIVEADKYDFRAPAFREMLAYLEEHKKVHRRTKLEVQTSFDFNLPLFIICGPSCAGKTVLAEYMAKHYGYYHIEASDFMYLSYYQRHGVSSITNIGHFAEQALREQPEIVAEKILRMIQLNRSAPIIITGFRSPAEIAWFRYHYTGKYTVEVVYVSADEATRYLRSLIRRRDGDADDRATFAQRDAQQAAMGLAELEVYFESNLIENNENLENYFKNFETCYIKKSQQPIVEYKAYRSELSGKLEESILLALAEKWQSREYFTTTEIAQLINEYFRLEDKPKNKNNVSRYFNQTFYPYYEIKMIDGKRKYRLSNTGYGKARILLGGTQKISDAAGIKGILSLRPV